MKTKLIELLETLGYSAYLQGSFTDTKDYPNSFFTFWNIDSDVDRHYDNKEYRTVWSYWVNFYSINPALTDSVLLLARDLLKANGWQVVGKGQDIASGSPTHTGRSMEVIYIEQN